jgi:hypothetical protein
VFTTWITPFDWLTFGIVTSDTPPFESTIDTRPPEFWTVSRSPSTVAERKASQIGKER